MSNMISCRIEISFPTHFNTNVPTLEYRRTIGQSLGTPQEMILSKNSKRQVR